MKSHRDNQGTVTEGEVAIAVLHTLQKVSGEPLHLERIQQLSSDSGVKPDRGLVTGTRPYGTEWAAATLLKPVRLHKMVILSKQRTRSGPYPMRDAQNCLEDVWEKSNWVGAYICTLKYTGCLTVSTVKQYHQIPAPMPTSC